MTGAMFAKKMVIVGAMQGLKKMGHPAGETMLREHARLRLLKRFAQESNAPGATDMFLSMEDYALLRGWAP